MLQRALAPGRDLVRIVATTFGAESGMIGAALLAPTRGRRRVRDGAGSERRRPLDVREAA